MAWCLVGWIWSCRVNLSVHRRLNCWRMEMKRWSLCYTEASSMATRSYQIWFLNSCDHLNRVMSLTENLRHQLRLLKHKWFQWTQRLTNYLHGALVKKLMVTQLIDKYSACYGTRPFVTVFTHLIRNIYAASITEENILERKLHNSLVIDPLKRHVKYALDIHFLRCFWQNVISPSQALHVPPTTDWILSAARHRSQNYY